jgi:hypothetical protein
MRAKDILTLAGGLLLAQCASKPAEIKAANVSPAAYQSYTCPQLQQAALDLTAKTAEASEAQNHKQSSWSDMFKFGRVVDPDATRLAQLKGDLTAIEQTRVQKKC